MFPSFGSFLNQPILKNAYYKTFQQLSGSLHQDTWNSSTGEQQIGTCPSLEDT